MSKENESISPEEYGALMEKMTNVEELLEKAAGTDSDVDEAITGLAETIEKMAEEIATLKEADPIDLTKMATIEDILMTEDFEKMVTEANKTILGRLETIEKTPFFKGVKDGDLVVEKTVDGDGLVDKIVGSSYGMEV